MSQGRHTPHSGRHVHPVTGRHVKKARPARTTGIAFILIVGGLVLSALIYSIVSPSPHSPQKHAQPAVSSPVPTHAKPAPKPVAPPPARTAPSKPKPTHALPPTPSHPLVVVYTVKLGDNLSSIANMYHLPSYVPLYDANRTAVGNNPDLIHVGLRLRVPEGKHEPSPR